MFSLVSDSSKVALVTLCQHLAHWGVPLIDCQLYSEHLASMGACEIKRADFIAEMTHYCAILPAENAWQNLKKV
jgi:leucyl/phenylalanyl-tRNA--protein transferase